MSDQYLGLRKGIGRRSHDLRELDRQTIRTYSRTKRTGWSALGSAVRYRVEILSRTETFDFLKKRGLLFLGEQHAPPLFLLVHLGLLVWCLVSFFVRPVQVRQRGQGVCLSLVYFRHFFLHIWASQTQPIGALYLNQIQTMNQSRGCHAATFERGDGKENGEGCFPPGSVVGEGQGKSLLFCTGSLRRATLLNKHPSLNPGVVPRYSSKLS